MANEDSLERLIASDLEQYVERIADRALVMVRENLLAQLARVAPVAQEQRSQWNGIDSLSKLRKLCGGRFELLKRRWCGAGFPLKESRGGSFKQVQTDPQGWIELCNWLLAQGFEARLGDEQTPFFFEIRPLA